MKKKTVFFLLVLFLLFVVFAVNAQQGGYRGPGIDVITIEEAKTLRDETPVMLKGKIERFLGNKKYLFTDNTGSIVIEIENRLWQTLSIDENDLVEITGEIDRNFRRIEVEVEGIRKL
ncbi:MAG: NirD/YgiW/YdeI family stress tolerance protein [Treponema sp.]|nr:NirD/YgiW/YdeI family stress tolerance protein [Treponema sp.]